MSALALVLLALAPASAVSPAAPRTAPQASPIASPGAQASAPQAVPAPESAHARFAPEPARAEVGQPVRYVLAFEHALGEPVALDGADPFAPPAGASAAALAAEGAPTLVRETLAEGRARTRYEWTVRALEGGELAPQPAGLRVGAGASAASFAVAPEPLTVAAALAAGEDAPQPPTEFPPAPAEPGGALPLVLVLAFALVLAAALLVLALALRRRRRAPAPLEAGAEERLAALEPRVRAGGEEARVARELAQLVRAELERALGVERAAASDEEWLAALEREPGPSPQERERARALLVSLQAARYGGPRPTRFALEESLAVARELVAAARRIAAEREAARAGAPEAGARATRSRGEGRAA